jgi:hypothetical protein
MNISILIHILIYLNIISFIIGFTLCYILKYPIVNTNTNSQNKASNYNTKRPDIEEISKIKIEDTKFVIGIDTSNIEKKFSSLGDVTKTDENISNSINKLKNLKK